MMMKSSSSGIGPQRSIHDFAVPELAFERRGDAQFLRATTALAPYPRAITERLAHFAATTPEHSFLAARDEHGSWQQLSYAAVYSAVRSIGQALLDRGLSPARPLMILSGHSLDFALIELAALHVGVPVAPTSPAYSLSSSDMARLGQIADLIAPGMIYAEHGEQFARALELLSKHDAHIVTSDQPTRSLQSTPLQALRSTAPTPQVDTAFAAITPDTIAKILFTSGSTGTPKGVINTQRMLCSNQQAFRQLWPFLEREPPVLLEWLPWHHTFAGNVVFNLALYNGGTLYIDDGMPSPQAIAATLQNLREISPTIYFNVPAGYQALLPHLEQDAGLRASFFRRARMLYYAAASLPQDTWDRLDHLARQTTGTSVPMICGWGSTETAPMSTQTPRPTRFAGAIGVPAPGTEIKLCPSDDKLEARVRGPNVTPGYWKQPELTADAFDDEGYYRMGDAVRLVDAQDATQGLIFDGRLAENFKLVTGTFVHVGEVRGAVLDACAPLLQDVVVTGHDRDELGLLLVPNLAGCQTMCQLASDTPLGALGSYEAVLDALRAGISDYNRSHTASSKRIARALLLLSPLSIDRGELTDKGAVSQRGVLKGRAELVEQLYSDDPAVLKFGR